MQTLTCGRAQEAEVVSKGAGLESWTPDIVKFAFTCKLLFTGLHKVVMRKTRCEAGDRKSSSIWLKFAEAAARGRHQNSSHAK